LQKAHQDARKPKRIDERIAQVARIRKMAEEDPVAFDKYQGEKIAQLRGLRARQMVEDPEAYKREFQERRESRARRKLEDPVGYERERQRKSEYDKDRYARLKARKQEAAAAAGPSRNTEADRSTQNAGEDVEMEGAAEDTGGAAEEVDDAPDPFDDDLFFAGTTQGQELFFELMTGLEFEEGW